MSMIKLNLNKENVFARSILDLLPYMEWNPEFLQYMNKSPGCEHYRMLAEISNQLPDGTRISDLGTYNGSSALALSDNLNVHVTTYDIKQFIPDSSKILTPLTRPNIQMKIMPCQSDIQSILQSQFVFLDIDPHDGPEETQFVKLLLDNGFRGILGCDDIHLNAGMNLFWDSIPFHLKKIDVTYLGHSSGTGLVIFDPSLIDIDVDVI